MNIVKKNVPMLRFQGFNNEWQDKKLEDFGTFKNGINKSSEDFGHGYPFINLMDVFGKPTISNLELSLVNARNEELELYNLKRGDVLFIRSSVKREGVGETSLLLVDLKDTVYSGFLIRFRDSMNILDLNFKKYCFKTSKFRKKLLSLSTTSANTNINQESLSSLFVSYPTIPEQQKISTFLSSVDELIEDLRLQKKALEKYKKGMMQKLFSQKIRFKDANGKSFPHWEEKKFGELFTERNERKGNKECDMLSVTTNIGVIKQDTSIKKDNSSEDKSNYKLVHKGDIAYNTMRMWQGASGVSSFDGVVSPAYTVISLRSGDIGFYGFLFKQPRTIHNFYRYSQGLTSDTWNLKFKHFSEVMVTVSMDVKEQQKIANFLYAIDDLTYAKQNQITQAEEWKKGLMQKMFI